jgi:IgA Peptidase M64
VADPVTLHGKLTNASTTWNILILPDGYDGSKNGDVATFLADACAVKDKIVTSLPFAALVSTMTIVGLFVPSTDTLLGIDDSHRCSAPVTNTYFGARFCRDMRPDKTKICRSLYGDENIVKNLIDATPDLKGMNWQPVVIVNSLAFGGQRHSGVVWVSKSADWLDTVIHELGHLIGNLGDEYDEEGYGRHGPAEPAAGNVTTITKRDDLLGYVQSHNTKFSLNAWAGFIDPSTPIPTSVNSTCAVQTNAPADKAAAEAGGPIGLYEGAEHSPCGAFRPSPGCRMRYSYLEFCRVCSWTLIAKLGGHIVGVSKPQNSALVGSFVLAASYTDGTRVRVIFYHPVTGAYLIASVPGLIFNMPPAIVSDPSAQIDPGITSLTPFQLGGQQYLMALSVAAGRRTFFRVDETFHASLQTTWDSGIGGAPWTHSIVFSSGGTPHILSYNISTGAFAVERVNTDNAPPVLVYGTGTDPTSLFSKGWSHLVSLSVNSSPYALFYDATSGAVQIRALTPPGTGPITFVSRPGFWIRGITTIFTFTTGETYLLRLHPLSFAARLDLVRPAGMGSDFLAPIPTSMAASQIVKCHMPNGSPGVYGGDVDYIGFYSALTGVVQFYFTVSL